MPYGAFWYKASSFGTLIAAIQRTILKTGLNMCNSAITWYSFLNFYKNNTLI